MSYLSYLINNGYEGYEGYTKCKYLLMNSQQAPAIRSLQIRSQALFQGPLGTAPGLGINPVSPKQLGLCQLQVSIKAL